MRKLCKLISRTSWMSHAAMCYKKKKKKTESREIAALGYGEYLRLKYGPIRSRENNNMLYLYTVWRAFLIILYYIIFHTNAGA